MIIYVKLRGFKDCNFGQFETINARYFVSGELIRLRNRSKLLKRSFTDIIGLLQGAKSILFYFKWRVGDDFRLKNF